ncbi:MAG TPA: ROK family protein [Dermatophilaceae bacterium]|nr:ROK family protein [Dermatophilaceae bacterium]
MILAADIGGTKIAAARVDDTGVLASEVIQTPTPARTGTGSVVAAAVALLQRLRSPVDRAVAVSTAGVVDVTTGTVLAATSSIAGWAGTPLGAQVSRGLELPTWVLGDGNAFGIGLADAHRAANLLALVAGTGIGGSVILGGEPLLGAHHVGGHLGHVGCAQAAGMPCPCGREGHLEAVASGHGILAWYLAHGGDPAVATTAELTRRPGDDLARAALATGGAALGAAAGGLANALDPDLVVVGGSVAMAGGPWESALRASYADALIPALSATPIVVSRSGVETVLRGVARFASRRLTP